MKTTLIGILALTASFSINAKVHTCQLVNSVEDGGVILIPTSEYVISINSNGRDGKLLVNANGTTFQRVIANTLHMGVGVISGFKGNLAPRTASPDSGRLTLSFDSTTVVKVTKGKGVGKEVILGRATSSGRDRSFQVPGMRSRPGLLIACEPEMISEIFNL